MIRWILILPIRFYKKFISPMTGAHCRFYPSCSTYAMEAINTHGSLKGCVLALWRILRCNPTGGQGFDPVPPKGQFKMMPYRYGRHKKEP